MKLNEVSSDRIDELKAAAAMAATKKAGAVAAKGAKVAGQAAMAGAKKAAPVVGKVAKQAGAVAAKAGKAVGKEAGAAYKGAKEIGKNVVSMSGDAAKVTKMAAQDIASDREGSAKTAAAQKMQQQKAGMGAKLAGGKNAQKFTRGVQDLEGGKAIRADLAQELKPHITNLQNILANPQLRVKWLQLVKQANQAVKK